MVDTTKKSLVEHWLATAVWIFVSSGVAGEPVRVQIHDDEEPLPVVEVNDSGDSEFGSVIPASLQEPRTPQPSLRAPAGVTPPSAEQQDIFTPFDPYAILSGRATGIGRGSPSVNRATRGEVNVFASTDIGDLVKKVMETQNVGVQRRNPINHDVRPAGTVAGQVNVGGSYWFPARQDLDTAVSKLDSQLISEVSVIRGPYTVRHGPGLSFVDFELVRTSRSDLPTLFGGTTVDFGTNGAQWHGRQEVGYAGQNWGANIGYSHRTGNDYNTGAGFRIPTSFNSRETNFCFGFDPSPDSTIEFSYVRLDQTNVELPGQVYDINSLSTDAFEVNYDVNDLSFADGLSFEGWYNQTRLNGDAQKPGKRRNIPFFDEFAFSYSTNAYCASSGYSASAYWGESGSDQFMVGSDLRSLHQNVAEVSSFFTFIGPLPLPPFFFPVSPFDIQKAVPSSTAMNPGLFAEATLPHGDDTVFRFGARWDQWGTTVLDEVPIQRIDYGGLFIAFNPLFGQSFPIVPLNPGPVIVPSETLPDREFDLASFYGTVDVQVTSECLVKLGAGRSMRAPTLTELYAINGPYLDVLQHGGSFIFGNAGLLPEDLWQIDFSAQVDFGNIRFGGSAFHGWIKNYITYRPIVPAYALPSEGLGIPTDPLDPSEFPFQTVRFTNTDLATLAGIDGYFEVDVTDFLTTFATVGYVQGTDQTRRESGEAEFPIVDFRPISIGLPPTIVDPVPPKKEPLPGIPPLQSRLGVRFHPAFEKTWQVEVSARAVDQQTRVAATLLEQPTAGFAIWDLRTYWQRTPQHLLVAGVENFGDRFYREHLDLRTGMFQPGVSFYFGTNHTY